MRTGDWVELRTTAERRTRINKIAEDFMLHWEDDNEVEQKGGISKKYCEICI